MYLIVGLTVSLAACLTTADLPRQRGRRRMLWVALALFGFLVLSRCTYCPTAALAVRSA
jgi:hypothetical protein